MANKTVSMLRIRKLIQLLDDGLSQRQISAELKMGRNIVANYVRKYMRADKVSNPYSNRMMKALHPSSAIHPPNHLLMNDSKNWSKTCLTGSRN